MRSFSAPFVNQAKYGEAIYSHEAADGKFYPIVPLYDLYRQMYIVY